MQKNKNISIRNNLKLENETKKWEMVPTYFRWLTPEAQKEKANELNEIGKKKNSKLRRNK